MPSNKDILRVLAVSQTAKIVPLLDDMLQAKQYSKVVLAQSSAEARRALVDNDFNIVVINTPLDDELGVNFALDIAHIKNMGVLIMVNGDLFEQVSSDVERHGVVTLSKPTSKQSLYSAIKMLSAMCYKFQDLHRESVTLKSRMEEIRFINRAKLILVAQHGMSEPDAHRYIEKQAMDRGRKKLDIAQSIIRTYER